MPPMTIRSGASMTTFFQPAFQSARPMYMSSTNCPSATPTPPTASSASRRQTIS